MQTHPLFHPECNKGTANLYARISGRLGWIQATICKLSDFRSNYSFCPAVVCPVDLTLLGERNASVAGRARLPTVVGSMLTPPQDSVVQSPAPGTPILPGQTLQVRVTARDAANQTTANCTWDVRVPKIKRHSFVTFRARKPNSTAVKSYSLDVPFVQNYYYVYFIMNDLVLERTKDSVITLSFKRENPFNVTDSVLLQTFRVRGKNNFLTFNVTSPVTTPDNSTYRYVAYFTAKNIKKGTDDILYELFGQTKKL